jgi:hypothetical protein
MTHHGLSKSGRDPGYRVAVIDGLVTCVTQPAGSGRARMAIDGTRGSGGAVDLGDGGGLHSDFALCPHVLIERSGRRAFLSIATQSCGNSPTRLCKNTQCYFFQSPYLTVILDHIARHTICPMHERVVLTWSH